MSRAPFEFLERGSKTARAGDDPSARHSGFLLRQRGHCSRRL